MVDAVGEKWTDTGVVGCCVESACRSRLVVERVVDEVVMDSESGSAV